MLNIRSDELKVVGFFEDANQNNCVNIVGAQRRCTPTTRLEMDCEIQMVV